MLPLIIVSEDRRAVDVYLTDYRRRQRVNPYYWYEVVPEKKEITIDQIRAMVKTLVVFCSQRRHFVLFDFDHATIEAQSALLKPLEESNEQNQFILVAANGHRIITTIQSRCQIVKLDQGGQISDQTGSLFDRLVKEDKWEFLADPQIQGISREAAVDLCRQAVDYFRGKILDDPVRAPTVLRRVITSKKLIEQNNLNPQLSVDDLLIFIRKTYTM
ncbi:hypothetical protein M1523_04030 [Patescibacteria group bacterium]|nr:hypothetical protein [Patescibacteria group bacterium]MCL5091860.1 hypothetical protein [Patescibacteria group bacterium]